MLPCKHKNRARVRVDRGKHRRAARASRRPPALPPPPTPAMAARRTDASTSTDEDVQARPLCLFYFTHPFGVLSPEPPTLAAAPPHLARAFVDMEPASPLRFWTSADDSYEATTAASSTKLSFDSGEAEALRSPLSVVRLSGLSARDSLASSLLAGDAWRLVPPPRTLPPLRLPAAYESSPSRSSDDVWPIKCVQPARLSLPPIELPSRRGAAAAAVSTMSDGVSSVESVSAREVKCRKPKGVTKVERRARGPRLSGVRRVLARLLGRPVAGRRDGSASSPALRRALQVLRDAWPPPAPLPAPLTRCTLTQMSQKSSNSEDSEYPLCSAPAASPPPLVAPAPAPAPAAHMAWPGASPGLLRRRYSMPETIMRKYRLAQQRTECEESAAPSSGCVSAGSVACGARGPPGCGDCGAGRARHSALPRRLWARPACCGGCCSRSLDGSRAELRSLSPRCPRPRPDARDSDAMLKAAVRNSFGRGDRAPPARTALAACLDYDTSTSAPPERRDDDSFADSSDAYAASLTTAKETNASIDSDETKRASGSGLIVGRVSERSAGVENDDDNVPSYDTPLAIDTPSYELLEIVVSETSNGSRAAGEPPESESTRAPKTARRNCANVNIDEYVSNILVESLNSLTDQLECMNASIGSDRKINIVEKEIKVKLQNTGVNTIVHLSPTSNNQIIFGNEELYNNEGAKGGCDVAAARADSVVIHEDAISVESNNNLTPGGSSHHDAVNRAVLQQIQKLFRDELHDVDSQVPYRVGDVPGISHIEISNVDVFIDNNSDAALGNNETIEVQTRKGNELAELISSVGAGNYYEDVEDGAVVPRFSALPHTDSMEVNTSSDEAEFPGSDCTSLVDSLDDPNSPRSLLLRKSFEANARRAGVEVLDMLPDEPPRREKGESFFVPIEDGDRDCGKESLVVADRMPEKIKQRLRRRQLRLQSGRARAPPRRPALDRECRALLAALLDELIAKVALDEYRCARLRPRARVPLSRSDGDVCGRVRRGGSHGGARPAPHCADLGCAEPSQPKPPDRDRRRSEKTHVRGKLSLLTHPIVVPEERGPRRIYQKSEIREGNKCIEILEILEYVNGSQSSPETPTSDENQNYGTRCRKSRIPIPVTERIQRNSKFYPCRNGCADREIANSPPGFRDFGGTPIGPPQSTSPTDNGRDEIESARRGPPAPHEPRSRSNSLRFRRVFDSIPEEKSSLSIDSSNEDINFNRRASAPNLVDNFNYNHNRNGNGRHRATDISKACETTSTRITRDTQKTTRSTATSPLASPERPRGPPRRSAATSPAWPARPLRPLRPAGPEESPALEPPGDKRESPPGRRAPPRGRRIESKLRKVIGRSKSESLDGGGGAEGGKRGPRPPGSLADCSASGGAGSSDSSDSGGLLCPLAPRWLASVAGQARARRARRRAPPAPAPAPAAAAPPAPDVSAVTRRADLASAATSSQRDPSGGGWSVTVAGSCRAPLPADLEMRLRFPHAGAATAPAPAPALARQCRSCRCDCHCSPAPLERGGKLALTLKNEAVDSSILASKSVKKSSDALPEVETYKASRSKTKSSMKTRRGYSLHCWLPAAAPAPLRRSDGLSVLGCAIIPELKPRVPTMSERDLTRAHTPRHYLRS